MTRWPLLPPEPTADARDPLLARASWAFGDGIFSVLLTRGAPSQIDVPVRNSSVMAVMMPAERLAVASVASVPCGLAAPIGPGRSGFRLGLSPFGLPLNIVGGPKSVYDGPLPGRFRALRLPEERWA